MKQIKLSKDYELIPAHDNYIDFMIHLTCVNANHKETKDIYGARNWIRLPGSTCLGCGVKADLSIIKKAKFILNSDNKGGV